MNSRQINNDEHLVYVNAHVFIAAYNSCCCGSVGGRATDYIDGVYILASLPDPL